MKKLVVLGSGESGMGAARLAIKENWEVLVSDSGTITSERKEVLSSIGAQWEDGGHSSAVMEPTEEATTREDSSKCEATLIRISNSS